MMKKLLSLVFAIVLILTIALCGCSKKKGTAMMSGAHVYQSQVFLNE